MSDEEYANLCTALAEKIDTAIEGNRLGVVLHALSAVLARGIALSESTEPGLQKLFEEVVDDLRQNVQHFKDNPPSPAMRLN